MVYRKHNLHGLVFQYSISYIPDYMIHTFLTAYLHVYRQTDGRTDRQKHVQHAYFFFQRRKKWSCDAGDENLIGISRVHVDDCDIPTHGAFS